MKFITCLETHKLPPKKMKELENQYAALVSANKSNGMGAEAAMMAANQLVDNEIKLFEKAKYNAIKQLTVMQDFFKEASERVEAEKELFAGIKKKSWIKKFMLETPGIRGLFYQPSMNRELDKMLNRVDNISKGIEMDAWSKMDKVAEILTPDGNVRGGQAFSSYWAITYTNERKNLISDMWRAAAGEKVDGIAGEAGKQLRTQLDRLSKSLQKEGSLYNHIENHMPQIHNPRALVEAKFDTWHNDINGKLDWSKIKDHRGYLIPEEKRVEFLKEVYETLSTGGAKKYAEAGAEGKSRYSSGGSMARKRGHHRVLHFKTPSDYMAYNSLYGTDDLASTIMNHVESMSRDLAVMKNLGPNPDAFMSNMEMRLSNSEKLNPFVNKMYDVMVGRTAMSGAESELYKYSIGVNGMIRGSKLGSANIAALSDSIFVSTTMKMAGISEGYSDGLKSYFKTALKQNPKHAKLDAELQLMALDMSMGNLLNRIAEGETFIAKGRTKADKFMAFGQSYSSLIMKASGLQWITHQAKDSITIPAFGKLAYLKETKWANLEPDFRGFMEEHAGITEADWDVIRSADVTPVNDRVSLLLPSSIKDVEVSIKVNAYVDALRKIATNEPTLKTKAVTTQGVQAGSPVRYGLNSVFMFRSFPITMLNNHIRNIATRGIKNGKADELGMFMVLALSSGFLTVMLKDLISGKVPDVDSVDSLIDKQLANPEVWKRAALQSGALSIFDFVLSDTNRYGDTLEKLILGAPLGAAIDFSKVARGMVLAPIKAAIDGDTDPLEQLGRDTWRFLSRNVAPSSLWYTRLAMNARIGESIDRFIEGDNYESNRRRMERVMEKQGLKYLEVDL